MPAWLDWIYGSAMIYDATAPTAAATNPLINKTFLFFLYLWLCWTNTTLTCCCCAKSSARNNSSSLWWWAAANKQKKKMKWIKCEVKRRWCNEEKHSGELVLAHTGWPLSRNPILLISRNRRKRHPSLIRFDEKQKRNATNPLPLRATIWRIQTVRNSLCLLPSQVRITFLRVRRRKKPMGRERPLVERERASPLSCS